MLFAEADKCLGVSVTLAHSFRDGRDGPRVKHKFVDILRARITSICFGYPDANDLDALGHDPSIRMAVGKDPFEGLGLASQPTIFRFENDATWQDVVRASRSLIDLYCRSAHKRPPKSVILDVDTTFCQTCGERIKRSVIGKEAVWRDAPAGPRDLGGKRVHGWAGNFRNLATAVRFPSSGVKSSLWRIYPL